MITFEQKDVELIMQLVARPYVYPDMLAEVNQLRDKLDALLDDMEAEAEDYDLDDIDVADLDGYDFDALDLGDPDDDTDDW